MEKNKSGVMQENKVKRQRKSRSGHVSAGCFSAVSSFLSTISSKIIVPAIFSTVSDNRINHSI
ncbi:MAG: hypothetical protein LBU51_09965 [Bacteroidales bacterium]|jgi:hypothetical protein|nr:hypothetical protein [Bacteroidales bacterium]